MASLYQNIKLHKRALRSQSTTMKSLSSDEMTIGDGWAEGWISKATIDRAGEYVPPDQWILDEHKANPVGFKNHNHNEIPLIRWQHPDGRYSIEIRSDGLYGRAYFNLNTPEGRDLYKSFKSGHMRGFSPGFTHEKPVRGYVDGKPAKIIKAATVFEVSAVGIPCHKDALAINCKSATDASGKYPVTVPENKVIKFGAFPMADEPLVNEKSVDLAKLGMSGFLDRMVSGITSVFAEAKSCLANEPEDKRNEAYGLAANAYLSLKSFCEYGKANFKSMEWDKAETAIEKEFEGFGEAVKLQAEEDAAVDRNEIEKLIGEVVTKQLEPVNAEIATVKEVVTTHDEKITNHEQAIDGVIDVVQNSLAS